MSVKGKIMTSVATAVLGLSLITGGTVAYFNDSESTNSTFATGMLELGLNKKTIIQVKDIAPGDTMHGEFELTNDGTVDMKEIILHSSYEVVDNGEPNQGDDLGDHIRVDYLYNVNGRETIIFQKMLSELTNNPQQVVKGFPAGSKAEKIAVRFNFIDNGKDQNHFQADSLTLNWKFEAVQRDGDPDFQ